MRYIGILLFTLLAFAVTAQSGVRSHLAGRTAGDSTGLKVVVIDTTTSGADYGRTTLVDSTYLATALGVGSGTNLYNADGTIGSGRNGTITDSLTLTGGHLVIDQNIANKPALITTNGNSAGAATKAQLKFGWSGNPSISAYAQWITSTHTGGAGSGNAIDFWLSDGTATPTFPTDAMHAMTIERSSGQPRVGIGLGDNVTPGGMFEVNGGNMIIQGIGGAYDPSLSIYKDDGQSAGINFYDESSDRYWAFLHGNDDFTLSRYIADVFQDNPWRMYNSDGDMSVNYLAVNSSATNPTRPFEVHDDGVAATEFIVDPNTSSGYSVELNIGDVSADLSTSSGSRQITFSPNTTEVLNLDDTEITSKVDHEFDADFLDINNATGTSGQILSSLGGSNAGVDWIDAPSGGDTDWVVSGNHVYPTNTTDSVGIGNAAPGYDLHVTGDGYFSSQLYVGQDSPDGMPFKVSRNDASTTAELSKFANLSTGDAFNSYMTDQDGTPNEWSAGLDHSGDAWIISEGSNLSGNNLVIEDNGGNAEVGIGVSPSVALHVLGGGSGLRVETATSNIPIDIYTDNAGTADMGRIRFYNTDVDIGTDYEVGGLYSNKDHTSEDDHSLELQLDGNVILKVSDDDDWDNEGATYITGGVRYEPQTEATTPITLDASYYFVIVTDATSPELDLPNISSTAGTDVPIGTVFLVWNDTGTTLEIDPNGTDQINGAGAGVNYQQIDQDLIKFIAVSTSEWMTMN